MATEDTIVTQGTTNNIGASATDDGWVRIYVANLFVDLQPEHARKLATCIVEAAYDAQDSRKKGN